MASDTAAEQEEKRKEQRQYDDRNGFRAIFASQSCLDKGKKGDKKLADDYNDNFKAQKAKTQQQQFDRRAASSQGAIDGKGNKMNTSQSFHEGGPSWWRVDTDGGGAAKNPVALEKELESVWPGVFTAMDINGDGEISSDEIAAATKSLYEPIGLWLKSGHKSIDANEDGMISLNEWQAVRLKMIKAFGAPSSMAIDKLRAFVGNGQAKRKTGKVKTDKVIDFGFPLIRDL